MENYRTEFRNELITDSGGVRANEGDKILYNACFPAKQVNEGSRFSVWVKANIRQIENDQVWLDSVEVLKGFKVELRPVSPDSLRSGAPVHRDRFVSSFPTRE